jgi:hypothetical protein
MRPDSQNQRGGPPDGLGPLLENSGSALICEGCGLPLPWQSMGDSNENPRRYRWPWFVLAAFLLAVALAIAWLSFAVHREKQERDVNAPLPSVPVR